MTAPSPSPSPVDPGRAVLVCGPTAVGESTLGFGLFQRLLTTGPHPAYIDLSQTSFLAPDRVGDPGGHQLGAASVGELWAQYQAIGARQLVLTGRGRADRVVRSRRRRCVEEGTGPAE